MAHFGMQPRDFGPILRHARLTAFLLTFWFSKKLPPKTWCKQIRRGTAFLPDPRLPPVKSHEMCMCHLLWRFSVLFTQKNHEKSEIWHQCWTLVYIYIYIKHFGGLYLSNLLHTCGSASPRAFEIGGNPCSGCAARSLKYHVTMLWHKCLLEVPTMPLPWTTSQEHTAPYLFSYTCPVLARAWSCHGESRNPYSGYINP